MQNTERGTHQESILLRPVKSRWKDIFEKYDVNKDGQVPLSVLCDAIKDSNHDHIPPHAVRNILNKYDRNQDGHLSFDEFLDMVEHKDGRRLMRGWMNTYIRHTIPGRRRALVSLSEPDNGEYEEAYSCSPPPVCMVIISIIEFLLFFYDLSSGHTTFVDGPMAALFIYNPRRRIEAWRYVTYMFVHIGWNHLLFNALVQVLLGIPLEMVHGWYRVLIIYLSGVIAGSLGTSLADPSVFLAGASGGVYALITAHLATIIMNWSEMEYAVWQLLIFLVLTVTDVGLSIYNRYALNNTKVGYAAHFAGALAGLLLGLRVLRNLEVHPWEKTLYRVALIIYVGIMAAAVLWNIFVPEYYPKQIV